MKSRKNRIAPSYWGGSDARWLQYEASKDREHQRYMDNIERIRRQQFIDSGKSPLEAGDLAKAEIAPLR